MTFSNVEGIQSKNVFVDQFNQKNIEQSKSTAFDQLFDSAVQLYKDANILQNDAEQSEINFALGYATSVHDLAVAQQKANIALQYTVKVTNKSLEAYRELMNMQI